jgi:hypothetical protein
LQFSGTVPGRFLEKKKNSSRSRPLFIQLLIPIESRQGNLILPEVCQIVKIFKQNEIISL